MYEYDSVLYRYWNCGAVKLYTVTILQKSGEKNAIRNVIIARLQQCSSPCSPTLVQ